MRRRDFLTAAAASTGMLLLPRWARATPWGDAPDATAAGLLLPTGVRAEKVLEVFMYGGLGPFESFYVVEEYGRPDDPQFPNQQWYLFQSQFEKVFRRCGINMDFLLEPFAVDALGMQVKLGPLTTPLRQRKDILARMRVLVHRHDLEPHEAAIPITLSGQRLGSSRMAGIGAHVQRYHVDRDSTGRRIPYSYVLYPDNEFPTDNLRAASAVGFHPGSARPLDLRIDAGTEFQEWLSRPTVGAYRDRYDALVTHYTAKARARYQAEGKALRSQSLADHEFAIQSLQSSDALAEVIPAELLEAVPGEECNEGVKEDTTAMGLNLGVHLLTHPTWPARHVTVVDGGLIPASGGGAFDTHQRHLPDQTRNALSLFNKLVSHINEPGENDPSKIDLDDTMIVLSTEFGRTPYMQARSFLGTNHHPYGYVTVLIGGPIREEQAGILGAIGPDGWADRYVTPTESRAAILAAMGMYPFTHESFAVGDLRGLANEKDGLAWLNEIVLGRRS